MRVARRGAIGDHRHGLARRMAGIVVDLDVEDGGQAAQTLRANAQRIDLVENLDPHLLDLGLRPAQFQLAHVYGLHQAFLGQRHRLFRRAADADAQHAGRAPAGTHLRDHVQHPIDDRIAGVHHLELGLVFRSAALGRDVDDDLVPRHHLDRQDARRVVLGILAGEGGIAQDRGTQAVFGVEVSAPHAFIDHVLHRPAIIVQPAFHAPFDEDVDDAGVLADRAMPLRAHAAVGQDLGDGVLGRRALLCLIGFAERADIIHRMIIADELERVGYAVDQVGGFDERHLTLCPHICGPALHGGFLHALGLYASPFSSPV